MQCKDIIVHVGTAAGSGKRIELAARLAARHSAHLTGTHALAPPEVPAYIEVQLAGSFWHSMQKLTQDIEREASALFRKTCEAEGVDGEWRAIPGRPREVIVTAARIADLVVTGQPDPDSVAGPRELDLPADLAIGAGRPVLIVPHTGDFAGDFGTVLVAWNGSREATRAIHDALPLMQNAKTVHVAYVSGGRGDDTLGDLPGTEMAQHLARHGIAAEASPLAGTGKHAGDLLLNATADLDADLLIMGAYGRARISEFILGGVTQYVLEHMTVPVLMSH